MRILALLLTIGTGASGLAYEVAWERYLAVLLGSHGEATAAVLGIFLGGLSVGYVVFGRVARAVSQHPGPTLPRLPRIYGLLEIGIASACSRSGRAAHPRGTRPGNRVPSPRPRTPVARARSGCSAS